MGWNYLSPLKLQPLHGWSLGMDKLFHSTFFLAINYFSMMGLKLIQFSKKGHRELSKFDYTSTLDSHRFLNITKSTDRKIFNISSTKSENSSDCCLVLQLPLANPLKPGVKLRMKMYLEQRRQAMLQLHLGDQQFYFQLRWLILEVLR